MAGTCTPATTIADAGGTVSEEDKDTCLSIADLFTPNEESICEFGDIILVVSDDFHPTQKLRVSSCILAMASKPLKALFTRPFAEGLKAKDRTSTEPCEIEVKDPPTAMKQLCRLLHHSPLEPDGASLPAEALLELAVVADKYDCVESVRLQTDAILWNIRQTDVLGLEQTGILTAASYMLDHSHHFRYYTKLLVLQSRMIKRQDILWRPADLLPSSLFGSLFNQQNIVLQEMSRQVSELIQQFSNSCRLVSREMVTFQFIENLRQCSLWPLDCREADIRTLLERLKAVDVPIVSIETEVEERVKYTGDWEWEGDNGGWGGSRRVRERGSSLCGWTEDEFDTVMTPINPPTKASVTETVSRLEDLCVGVCLDCLKGKSCREPHRRHWADTSCGWDGPCDHNIYHTSVKHPGYWEDSW